jgi:hypothetical protein
MKTTKTHQQFLEDLFSFFKEKYSVSEGYEAYKYSQEKYKVCPLTIPNCPDWASPALMLKNWEPGRDEMYLLLTLIAPSPGYNEEIGGITLTIYTSNKKGNNAWITLNNNVGGGNSGMRLAESDIETNDLCVEVEKKALELFATGVYDFVPQKEPLMSLL